MQFKDYFTLLEQLHSQNMELVNFLKKKQFKLSPDGIWIKNIGDNKIIVKTFAFADKNNEAIVKILHQDEEIFNKKFQDWKDIANTIEELSKRLKPQFTVNESKNSIKDLI